MDAGTYHYEHGRCQTRWWLHYGRWSPLASNRLQVVHRIRYTNGEWSQPTPAKSYSDGSGLLDALAGSDALDAALGEFAASREVSVEDLRTSHFDCIIGLHRAAKKDRVAHEVAMTGDECFVRFGDLPTDGHSRNHRENTLEPGVSVYRGRRTMECVYIYLSGTDQASALFIIGSRQMYLVSGRELGTGSDGEPLLARGCRAEQCDLRYEIIGSHV